jgi:hypothetical protein
MRLRNVANPTATVARVKWGTLEAGAEPSGDRWQLGDINRNFLTVGFELSIC